MASQPIAIESTKPALRVASVYGIAASFLLAGLAIGYLSRGLQSATPSTQVAPRPTAAPSSAVAMAHGRMPSLEEMKQMADKQAGPLLAKLENDPKDTDLLVQVGAIYHTSHQFKEAAVYYNKAVEIEPKNVALRTKLASSLYRDGDVDGAIVQLNRALRDEPTDANSLFNLGMIKLQGKDDARGAFVAWQKLLKTNPQLSPDRKAEVQKLMADALTMMGDQRGVEGVEAHDRR